MNRVLIVVRKMLFFMKDVFKPCINVGKWLLSK